MRFLMVPVVVLGLAVPFPAGGQQIGEAIDLQRSSITIHVGKSGFLAGAAHEHWVNAPIESGRLEGDAANPRVRLTIRPDQLSVRQEKGFSEGDRAAVQSNMQSKVLESARFPRIEFASTSVRRKAENEWEVSGNLTLHGVTRPVGMAVSRENGAWAGAVQIRQTDFGIEPIRVGGGLVKVKDVLDISVRIYTVFREREQ